MASRTLRFTPKIRTRVFFTVIGEDIFADHDPLVIYQNDYGHEFDFETSRGSSPFRDHTRLDHVVFTSPSGEHSTEALAFRDVDNLEDNLLQTTTIPRDFREVGYYTLHIETIPEIRNQGGSTGDVFITSPTSLLVLPGLVDPGNPYT